MKFMFLIVMFVTGLNASPSSLAGQWTGWGELNYDGSGANCPYITFKFEETEKTLIRKSGYYDCEMIGIEVYPDSWTIDGSSLYYGDDFAGTYEKEYIQIIEKVAENRIIISTFKIDGLHMDYEEIWYLNNEPLYTLIGRLFKKTSSF